MVIKISENLMSKSKLIEALAQNQCMPTKTAASIVNTILDARVETLVERQKY